MTGHPTVWTYHKVLRSLLTTVVVILSSLHTPISRADTPTTALVGQLSGQFSVENGAASYSIPIKLPPGVAGMQPEISINYNSNGGNGLLGVGFSLGGQSAITRCPATYAQDGFKGGVYFDQRDRYCLDGQRLIAISGSDGGDGSEYRTEIDGNSKIVSYGQQGNGPSYWKVWTKSGQIFEYGNTDDARVERPSDSSVRAWAVNSISDTVGNTITYTYQKDTVNGEHHPLRVDYGDNSVRFEYEPRSDQFIGYQAGSKISLTQRLARVTVHVGEPQILEYDLRYRDDQRSLLAGITQVDANGDAMPELVFDWGLGDETELQGFEPLTRWQFTSSDNGQYRPLWSDSDGNIYSQYLDINGDGLPDRVHHKNYSTGEYGIWVALNNGSDFDPLVRWEYTVTNSDQYRPVWKNAGQIFSQFLDINGDGLPDRVNHHNYATGEDGLWVALNNGSGFDTLTRWQYDSSHIREQYHPEWYHGSSTLSQFLDINGDGLPDRVNHKNYSTGEFGIWVALNNGNGFEPLTRWGFTSPDNGQYNPRWANAGQIFSQFLDINGDGLPDRVNHRNYATGEDGLWVALNNGSGFDAMTRWQYDASAIREQYHPEWYNGVSTLSQFLDINGDGLPDRVNHKNYSTGEFGIWVALNNGNGFEPLTRWEFTSPDNGQYDPKWANAGQIFSQFLDINGDGLPDRVNHRNYATGEDGLWVALNNGSGFDAMTRWQYDSSHIREQYHPEWYYSTSTLSQFLDINGDGLPDRVNHKNYSAGEDGIWAANSKQKQPRIVGITPLGGNETRIEYKHLTDSSVYTKGTGAVYPEIDLGGPMAVVSRVESSNGIGGSLSTSYQYGGAKVNVLGRGLLGFAWIESTDEQTGIISRTEYRQDFPYSGMVTRSEQRLPDSTLIGETTTQYAHTTSYNDKVYALEVTQSIEQSYELDGSLVSSVTTDNANIDAYGNVGTITVTTQAGGESYSKVSQNSYTNDAQRWILGRLTQATVTHHHNNGTQETRNSSFSYDINTGLLLTETVEPGSSDAITTTYQYDQFGNKISATISADGLDPRTTTTTYDAQGHFPISSSNALGHTETKVYDPICGQPASLTGPNGLTTSWEYDTLCRKIRESRADGTETTWSYAWDDGSGPQYALYKITESSSGKPPASVWYDALGRKLRKQHTGFDGTPVYQDTDYNSLGQIERKSLPYFSGDTSYWVESDYDILGRSITTRSPAPGGGIATATTTYQGLTTVSTNALGQSKTSLKNALGKVARVDEEEGGWVEYQYDAVGNLIQTNAAGVITVMEYDLRGRKTAMDDPDMGHWTYDYNAYGELISQTDAKGQTVTMEYDDLGRMVTRTETEGTTTWSYDSADHGIGKIAQVQAPMGYLKTYSYDTLGRPSVTTTNADSQSFSTSATYDTYSRVSMVTRPQGFQLENIYNEHGYLSAIRTPSSQIEDYDFSHLNFLLDTALSDAQTALDNAQTTADSALYYQQKADEYLLLSGDPTLDPDLQAQLQASAAELDAAADLLNAQLTTYIELAEQLLEIADQLLGREEILLQRYAYSGVNDNIADYQAMVDDTDHIYFWRAKSRDAAGRLSSHISGNGLVTDRDYDPATGQLQYIRSGFGYAAPIRRLEYQYDALDNVTSRQDHIQGLSETFEYDRLNRLTNSHVSGQIGDVDYNYSVDYTYDALGNMLSKSDVGSYSYGDAARSSGNAGPHAITDAGTTHTNYQYDLNGSLIQGGGRTIQWTSYNKPRQFQKDGHTTTFSYGPDRARYLKVTDTARTVYIDKSYEKITEGDTTKHKHFIYADGQLVAIHVKSTESGAAKPDETRYLHRDSLGSIDTITDGRGNIVERMSFEPFGKRRAGNWRSDIDIVIPALTNRGFTGHEHVDEMGLIHMNGRVYDPELGRFLSADPHVQNPYSSQSYNRYSYVQNNPLKYTDPSGFFSLSSLWKKIKKFTNFTTGTTTALKIMNKYPWVRAVVAAVAAYFTGGAAAGWASALGTVGSSMVGGAAAGFVAGGIMTGTLKGAFRGALFGGLSAGIAGYIKGAEWGEFATNLAHGVTQGGLSEAFGGDFRSGFMGAFFGHSIGAKLKGLFPGQGTEMRIGRTIAAAISGGISSRLGGGKFANGAISAAFVHVFNSEGGAGEGYYDKQKTWESEMRLVEATGGGDIATLLDAASLLAPGASVSINLDGNAHYYERYHLMQTERIYIDKATGDILDSQYIGEKKWYHDMGYGPQDGFKHIGKGVYEWNVRTFSPIAPKVIKLPYQADRYRNFF